MLQSEGMQANRDWYWIFGLGEGDNIMLECQMCIRYVIVLAIIHILIGIGLTNKLQNRYIELQLAG